MTVAGEKLYINALISQWGVFRPRISVELIVTSEAYPKVHACVYFERFKSGKLSEPFVQLWELVLVGVIVLGVLVMGGYTLFG